MNFLAALVRKPLVVFACVFAWLAIGIFAYTNLDIEAYPNPVPPMIEIVAPELFLERVCHFVGSRQPKASAKTWPAPVGSGA